MQTFLPYADFAESARSLDLRRLGKQIIENRQINKAIIDPDYGWQNHPAVNMWRGYQTALFWYAAECADEWTERRGKMHGAWVNMLNDDMVAYVFLHMERSAGTLKLPPFIGDEAFHRSHRSNLLRKDYEHYSQFFGTDTPTDLDYIWPVGV